MVGASGLLSQSVMAQDAPNLEEVTVSGSRIVRDGYNAPTPTTVVGEEALRQQGAPTVIEYLNTVPSFAGNYTPASSTRNSAGSPGTASVNLRNLGTNRTLVLINGQRTVGATPNGVADISSIPQQLISRIDVVTGGASAAYGSDAVAGVVDFILDNKFSGVKGEVNGGATNYGDARNYEVALTAGTAFANDRGHVVVSGGWSHNEGILLANRDWNNQGWQIMNNPAYTPTNGQPAQLLLNHVAPATGTKGGIIVSGPLRGTAFGQGGTPYQYNYGPLVSGGLMQGGEWWAQDVHSDLGATMEPKITRSNVFLRASFDVTDNIEVYAQGSFARSKTLTYAYGSLFFGGVTIPASNAFLPASVAERVSDLGLTSLTMGMMNADMGRNGLNNARDTKRGVVGVNGAFNLFGSNWKWDAYYQIGESENEDRVRNSRNTANYTLAVDSVINPATGAIVCRSTLTDPTNGCVPYNPFGIGVNSRSALDYVMGTAMRDQTFKQEVAAASINGDPFSSWAGPVSIAAGIEHRRESADGVVSALDLQNVFYAGNYRPTVGSYDVTEGFVESVVPLAKDLPGARTLDFNGALRYTEYSLAGDVVTWKAGFTWSPIDDVTFRFTRSRDIRAPNLNDLFNQGSTQSNNVLDPASGQSIQLFATTRGNINLTPEEADTTGFGVVFQPSFISGFSASVDYWNIKLNNAITNLTMQQVVNLCAQGNTALCANINNGQPLNPASAFNRLFIEPINLATREVRGIDFETSYTMQLDDMIASVPGRVSFRALATHYMRNELCTKLAPCIDSAGENSSINGGPVDWRWTATINYQLNAMDLTFGARGVSNGVYNNSWIGCTASCPTSTTDNQTINRNRIAGATYFDLSMAYRFELGDKGNFETFFNVRNLLNRDPVIVAGNGNLAADITVSNPLNYDQNGRVYRAGARFNF